MMNIAEKIRVRLNEAKDDTKKKGLSVMVYRTDYLGDTTNRGLSSKHDQLTIIDGRNGKVIKGNRSTDEDGDYLIIMDNGGGDLIAVPSKLSNGSKYKFGGNFIFSNDNNFPSKSPIKVFDRVE